jgi:hypothetical protein
LVKANVINPTVAVNGSNGILGGNALQFASHPLSAIDAQNNSHAPSRTTTQNVFHAAAFPNANPVFVHVPETMTELIATTIIAVAIKIAVLGSISNRNKPL